MLPIYYSFLLLLLFLKSLGFNASVESKFGQAPMSQTIWFNDIVIPFYTSDEIERCIHAFVAPFQFVINGHEPVMIQRSCKCHNSMG